jgi:pimeloyl-ACP methyl ester carboxylesterase/predicted GNAT superfamily acetyltransferase
MPDASPRFPADLDGVTFYSDGCRLLGGFYRAEGDTPRPTVILLHGLPGVEKNLDLAHALRDAGFNCLYFHYRGCWGSEGHYSLTSLEDDVRAATEWALSQPSVDSTKLALVGNSLGGYLTLAAGAADRRFAALVALCPLIDPAADHLARKDFDDFAAMLNGITGAELEAQWRALTPLTQMANRLADRPILLLTGDRDTLFPLEHYPPLVEAVPGITWRRFAQGDHGFSLCRPAVVRAVVDWLATTLIAALPERYSGFTVRAPVESDYLRVLNVLPVWWGGRDLGHLLPRLYFQHFNDTSFIVEKDGALAAFLVGFMSQSEPGVAYIHFVGVKPEHRLSGLARALYERFFALVRAHGAREVHCITAPVNTGSVAFHTRLGFTPSQPIADYEGPGNDRVTFKKMLG